MQHTTQKILTATCVSVVLFGAVLAYASDSRDYRDHNDGYKHARNYSYDYDTWNNRYYDGRHYDDYRYSQKPSCSITVSSYSGTTGYDRYITLAWSSSYATSAHISGIGSVGTNGAQAVYYPYNSSYTLTVYGPGGSATCVTQNRLYSSQFYYDTYSHGYNYGYPYAYGSAHAYPSYSYPTYASPTYVAPTYAYPTVAATTYVAAPAASYVKLSQTPYTGFDFGLFGNSLYWLGMLLISMLAAYSLVFYRAWFRGALPREVLRAARNQLQLVRSIVR